MEIISKNNASTQISNIEKIHDLLIALLETHSHELSEEDIRSKELIKNYFLNDSLE